jgi:hypothetical protein
MPELRLSVPNRPDLKGTWVRAAGGDLPQPVLVRLGLSDDGRLVATGLHIEAPSELAARDLRLPLAWIVGEIAARRPDVFKSLLAERLEYADRIKRARGKMDTLRAAAQPVGRPVMRRARPGRRGHPDAHYRQVAQAYRRAKRQHPRGPIRALMEELHASEPTVHRWLNTAVEKGFLEKEER